MVGGGSREDWGLLFYIGEIKNFAFFQTRTFSKMLKNQWKIYNFKKISKFTYKNLNGKLIFYQFSLQSSRTFVIIYTTGTYKNFRGWFGGLCRRAWGLGSFDNFRFFVGGGVGGLCKPLEYDLFDQLGFHNISMGKFGVERIYVQKRLLYLCLLIKNQKWTV